MADKPDDDKILADLSECEVKLEDDPAAAGGPRYISEKLREVRDKTETMNGRLNEVRLWHTAQITFLNSNKQLYKVKKREAMVGMTAADRRGKSQTLIVAEIETQPEMIELEEERASLEADAAYWATIMKMLEDKVADLRRANSDVRLQANIHASGLHAAGTQGEPSEWGQKRSGSGPPLTPEGDQVDAKDV